ncbi:MAG: hypothetical protein ABI573_10810 [Chloroflexota bacterium]
MTTTGYEPPPQTSLPRPTGTVLALTDPPPSVLPGTGSDLLPLGPLESGTHVSAYMSPGIAFTIPDGFSLRDEETDLLYLTSGPDQFPPDFAILRSPNQGIIDMLAAQPNLLVSRATEVSYPLGMGRSIDIEPVTTVSDDVAIASTADANAGFFLTIGTRGRVFEFDLDGSTLIVLFTAPANQFAPYAKGAEPIVASIMLTAP